MFKAGASKANYKNIVVDMFLPNAKCHIQMPLGHPLKQPEKRPWCFSRQGDSCLITLSSFMLLRNEEDLSGECSA